MRISEGSGSPTASLSATPEPQAASHKGLLGEDLPHFQPGTSIPIVFVSSSLPCWETG